MHCFARSGGTVLNQCIGSLPNVVIMSEVSSFGGGKGSGPISHRTIKEQAKAWYNIDLKNDDYIESALELHEYCEKHNLKLVIREWSFINFVPQKYNNFNPPKKLYTLEQLTSHCKIIPFAFVRDAIDVCISRNIAPNKFSPTYLNYVKELINKNIKIFKYEDFCKNPNDSLKTICHYTNLQFSHSYKDYLNFNKVNGDVQNPKASRGIKQKRIQPLPRKIISRKMIKLFDQNKQIKLANKLLGYPLLYSDVQPEKNLLKRIKYFFI